MGCFSGDAGEANWRAVDFEVYKMPFIMTTLSAVLAQAVVDPGAEIRKRTSKYNMHRIISQRNTISFEFCACTKTISV